MIAYLYKLDYLAALIFLLVAYWKNDGSLLFFIAWYLVFDLGAAGYAISPQVGNVLYNLGHLLVFPLIFLTILALFPHLRTTQLINFNLIWLAHICLDRTFGWGLMPR
ncbi:DUF4260 family protein [Lactobacillus panisapium]|uniref:DUF4260 family protein n=1 Tax=Lactobacillus panisapium TaxID=2012495 RepID=UPI000CDB9A09|nr:DUF4260 family protein [Lactobacillus panisapium]QYN53885.1 DUF4260 family protein [Lactobacillus panisapium]